jgi:molybdopterin synthase catalytic subunit
MTATELPENGTLHKEWFRTDFDVAFSPLTQPIASDTPHDRIVVQLTNAPLDLSALTDAALDPRCGGVASFIGTTRNHHGGLPVARLEYEAYVAMAVREMEKIGRKVVEQFEQVHRVVIAHRLGVVPVTGSSVIIIVASEHRASGLAAVGWAIDELKTTVPIWKREFYVTEQGDEASTTGPQCCAERAAWKTNPEFLKRFRPELVPRLAGDSVGSAPP